jgi:N-methylhydantoinase B
MGALSKAIPERVLADGAGPCWALIINGEGSSGDKFVVYTLLAGGQGAASWGPGMDVVNFPGNAANTPVEVLERLTSLRVEAKERIRQSGGQGRNRGGDGQRMVLRALTNKEVTIAGWIDRTEFAATGLQGGGAGALGRITVNGNRVSPRERIRLSSGDRLVLETPGGGGYGLPSSHDT